MAKITPGPLAGVISGKIGNTVFSRGRYGPYMRNRMMPTRVVSAATSDVRNRLSGLAKLWGGLGAPEKIAWATYANTHPVIDRLGNSQVLQASAAFMQVNARVLQALGTVINVPPVGVSPAPIVGMTVVAVATAQAVTISYTSPTIGADECLAVRLAVLDSPGRAYYRNLLKLVVVSAAAQATTYVISTPTIARFGKIIIGQKYFCEVEVWSKVTGLISGRTAANFTVIAA